MRNPDGPTVSPKQKKAAQFWLGAVLSVALFGGFLLVTWLYPWPQVTTSSDIRMITVPAPGGLLEFERGEVCIPEGNTTVERFIEARPDEFGNVRSNEFDTLLIEQKKAVCVSPNITRIIIPDYTPVGQEFRIKLVATTTNPTIWSRQNVSYSPWFTVKDPKKG